MTQLVKDEKEHGSEDMMPGPVRAETATQPSCSLIYLPEHAVLTHPVSSLQNKSADQKPAVFEWIEANVDEVYK